MKKYVLMVIMLLGLALDSFSATQGSLGTSSTGTVNIGLTIIGVVQISNLSDITLEYTPGLNTDLTSVVNVCIYSNSLTSSNYFITATSTNAAAGVMRVSNGAGTPAYIPYTVQWYIQVDAGGTATSLVNATKNSTAFTGASSSSASCGGNPNASFKATFLAADLEAAGSGTYSDTLTFLLSSS